MKIPFLLSEENDKPILRRRSPRLNKPSSSRMASLPLEIIYTVLHWIGEVDVSEWIEMALISRKWYPLVLERLKKQYYTSRVATRIGLERLVRIRDKQQGDWTRICMFSLACLHSFEWGLGAPRLFYIGSSNDSQLLQEAMQKHPDPSSQEWRSIIKCSLDVQDVYTDLTQSESSPMILRYSERMDLGCFLIYLRLDSVGPVLLRVKPIGSQETSWSVGDGRVIIWDEKIYGTCNMCQMVLPRVQVCADCRIAQYCSRICQRKDWDIGHKNICKSLAFVVHEPDKDLASEESEGRLSGRVYSQRNLHHE
ncbi:hypothetical protein EDD86DRAFT_199175, partial [Gorgonomyces haynaldii]